MVAILQTMWVRTKQEKYLRLTKLFGKIFLINFAMGVVTGIVQEFSERGGLDAVISEAAGNISGGQAQRLAIARGLLVEAAFFILDEPTSGLDWDNAEKLMGLLRQITLEGRGVIVITHDLELAKLCDEIIRLG